MAYAVVVVVAAGPFAPSLCCVVVVVAVAGEGGETVSVPLSARAAVSYTATGSDPERLIGVCSGNQRVRVGVKKREALAEAVFR